MNPLQPVTSISSGGKVELKTFDASVEGLIESFAARFPVLCDIGGAQQ